MATSCQTLINRIRRMVGDWPEEDALTASLSSTASVVSVADGTLYPKNFQVEVDSEVMTVSVAGSGTTFTVRRGSRGSTAATHLGSAVVLIRPAFYQVQIIEALNAALDGMFPLLYKPVSTEYTGITSSTYEYTIPNMTGIGVPIPYISKLEMKEPGDLEFWEFRNYSIMRGEAPFIKLNFNPTSGSKMRISGFGPFAHMAAVTDTLDAFYPAHAEDCLVAGAAAYLLMAGEAARVRVDTLATDAREQANRVGGSLSASAALYSRFRSATLAAAMPPLPKHAKPTF